MMRDASGEFRYLATDAAGVRSRGTTQAVSREDAVAQLTRMGLLVITIAETPRALRFLAWNRKMSLTDAATGLNALGEMLNSGMPLARAIEMIPELAPRSWRAAQPMLLQSVREGMSLSAALARGPVTIPPVAMGLIVSGELSGQIGRSAKNAGELLERQQAQRNAIATALAYPTFLATVGLTTAALLVIYIFPRMASLLEDLGQGVPPATQSLIVVGQMVRRFWLLIVSIVVLGIVATRHALAIPANRRRLHASILRVPIVGDIRHSAATSQICMCMSAMLAEGLPVSRALAAVEQVIEDYELQARLYVVMGRVTAGGNLAAALRESNLLTPLAARMIAVGDQSGNLAGMFRNAATIEAANADRSLRMLAKFAEPALVLLLGASVMYVAAALLQAVYAITPSA